MDTALSLAESLLGFLEKTFPHELAVSPCTCFSPTLPTNQGDMFAPPVIFTTFCGKGTSNAYTSVPDAPTLKKVLDSKLQEYNESNAMMDLVLFDQAMV